MEHCSFYGSEQEVDDVLRQTVTLTMTLNDPSHRIREYRIYYRTPESRRLVSLIIDLIWFRAYQAYKNRKY